MVKLLGEGGAGSVYLAEHSIIKSRVAIKVLSGQVVSFDDVYARFVREARATNTIVSPHIPRYYDFGQLPDHRPYAIMEYFEGETLAAYLARRGALTLSESASILRQLAAGMCAAHQAGVIHRDLKPDNVFVVPQPGGGLHVVILDFGIAKLLGSAGTEEGATQTGMFIGTPHYCAPEQIAATDISAATDVYALGVIAYELLTGARPFDGEGLEPLRNKLAAPAPRLDEQLPSLPPSVVSDVALMLERDPRERMATMKIALMRFDVWARTTTHDAMTLALTPLPERLSFDFGPRRPRPLTIAAIVAMVAVAFGVGWMAHRPAARMPSSAAAAPPAASPTPPTAATGTAASAPAASTTPASTTPTPTTPETAPQAGATPAVAAPPTATPIEPAPAPVPVATAPAATPSAATPPAATSAKEPSKQRTPKANKARPKQPDVIIADPFQ